MINFKNPNLYFIISFMLFIAMILKIPVMPQQKNLFKFNKYIITVYGIVFGSSLFISICYLDKCNINFLKLIILFILACVLMILNCKECKSTYNYISLYIYLLPLLPLLFDCSKIGNILTAISIGAAIGRLGCISAGCCHGYFVNKNNPYAIIYPDPEQLVNKINKRNESYCFPSTLIEAIIQFFVAGLCLKYKQHTTTIFCISNILIVFLSTKLRKIYKINKHNRSGVNLAYLSLIFMTFYCFNNETIFLCDKPKKIKLWAIIISLIIIFIMSNDLNFNDFKNIHL